jgi:broad specificity phosphatase PhoE
MTDTIVTTVDLLRHGRTTADDILRGRIDVPLSDEGYQQMQQRVASYLDTDQQPRAPWHNIVSSPLQRCAKFAGDLNQQHNIPITINDEFLEMDFGDWDGRDFAELKAQDPELFANIWRRPDKYQPPNGETFSGFSKRIGSAWHNLIEQHQGQHVLLVCHGGVIRALLGEIMQTPLTALSRIEVPYACLSRIRLYHQRGNPEPWPQLVFHNPH